MTGRRTLVRADRAIIEGCQRAASVLVDGERIAGVLARDAEVASDREIVLAADEVLLPGLVDTHVHVNEPGRTEWEGFACATGAAALGGVTTLVDMPLNSLPATVDVAALQVKRTAARSRCAVDVGFWGGAIPGRLAELPGLHRAGVFGFKCFLSDSGVPEFPPLSGAQLRDALGVVAGLDAVLIVHAEDPAELTPAPPGPGYRGFLASRPPRAEDRAIATLLAGARHTGARVHVLHLSSASALPLLARAKADGVRVSVETCPHYLALTAEQVPDGDTRFKCCPPVREAANRDALWAGLAEGTIDLVVSDHSPCPPELKRAPDFGAAWGGIASLQLGLSVMWTEARARGHTLAEVVDWMGTRPARLVGLAGKGRIRVGADADLVVFAPEQRFTVDPGRLRHRHPVTPYAGRELVGQVRLTWLRGAPVRDAVPRGRLLRRDR